MRYSQLFGKTEKKPPADAVYPSHALLHQAGYIRESTSGRYFFLPLGMRVQQRIMHIIKEEMDAIGAQETLTPVLHPIELWKETNRTQTVSFELMAMKDRRNAEFALGGTAEEMYVDLVRKFQLSYKDMPFTLYQFSTKFRDELRARGGLLRVREFIMKDAYSFDVDEQSFKKEYEAMRNAYTRIFERLGLKTIIVESDNGYIGGEYCHEFVVESPVGESTFLVTDDGSYAAHEEVAQFIRDEKNADDAPLPLEKVHAERGPTMADGIAFHKIPDWQQIKNVLYIDEKGRFILAVIRGDYEINEVKLKHEAGSIELRSATDEEIRTKLHSEPGFLSPIGLPEKIAEGVSLRIIADTSLETITNAVSGANEKNTDYRNIVPARDIVASKTADIARAKEGYLSPDNKPLYMKKGIEVGNIFQLGYHYTTRMSNAEYIDSKGEKKPYYMGCYGIGVGRTMAALVEVHHDTKGIIWPETASPYTVHLIGLDLNDPAIRKRADSFYESLTNAGIEALYDDRDDVGPGEKFADCDLIGIPIRLIISKKTGDSVEWKNRSEQKSILRTDEEVLQSLIST